FESFPEYLDAIEQRGTAINLGALIGHTPVRTFVMGEEATEREATEDEVTQMEAIVADALRAGAIGFATSWAPTHVGYEGRPVPSRASALSEIQRLAGCMGEVGHGTLQATIGRGLFLSEFTEIFKATGRPISWTALLGGMFGPEGHRGVLESCEKLQDEGIEIYPQVTPRPLMFEFQWKAPFPFESMSMFRPVSQGDHEERKRIYADPGFRQKLRERGNQGGIAARWEETWISEYAPDPSLEEQTVADVAAARGVHPADLALDLGLATDLEARFRMAVMNTDEQAVAELLSHPASMLGLSDAGAHASQLCDACAPTYLLAHWVREKGVLTLEQAVRLLTSRSADVFGIHDRGRLAPGLAADVTIFDPDTVGCSPLRRVCDQPAGADRLISDAEGIEAVIVNGTPIREHGESVVDERAELPGTVLRGSA
ncbi:MAG: amidohydrolase family protein, partial [Myxococcota bacterium]